MANGGQAIGAVGSGEDFALHDAGAVTDGDKLHGLAVLLDVRAANDDEAADGHPLVLVVVQLGDGAVGAPVHLWEAVQGMPGDGAAHQLRFIFQPLLQAGLCAEGGAQLVLVSLAEKPALARLAVMRALQAVPEVLCA